MLPIKRVVLFWLIIIFAGIGALQAQGTWIWNGRTHPELHYKTLTSDHFYIHYHQGLQSVANKVARIAEQTYPTLMKQVDAPEFGRTSITLTSEDEIMNGYAMPSNQIFIWVSQNDVAGNFGGSEKWLRLVVPHEMEHVVMLNALRTWLGIWNLIVVPSWFIEGTAEYYTESWRVGRSDASMKIHTYKNDMDKLNAHDDGYAKILYLADQYGDSTITKIVHWRDSTFKYYDFNKAFKSVIGKSVKVFNEDWRRAMNTYYYSYRGQKETIPEIGKLLPAPKIRYVSSGKISPDSQYVAIVGRTTSAMKYQVLYTITTDSVKTIKPLHSGRFGSMPAWSTDEQTIAIGEYHRGSHGSLIYDIRKIRSRDGKNDWLTNNMRANHPVFSKDGKTVYFIAHPELTTNLYKVSLAGGKPQQITSFTGDVQLNYPAISPDGKWIAFMMQDESGDVDIAIIDTAGKQFRKLTNDSEEDLQPVWTADGRSIIFASYRNSTSNLYRVQTEIDSTRIEQMTDVYSGVYPVQVIPRDTLILSRTLGDVDTTRLVAVHPDRSVKNQNLVLKNQFEDWRTTRPDNPLPAIDYDSSFPSDWSTQSYRFWRHPRHLASLALPTTTGISGFTAWTDDLGKHQLLLGVELNYTFYKDQVFNGLVGLYSDATWYPFINLLFLGNAGFEARPYDSGWITDTRSGGGIQLDFPFNFGNSLYSNHDISLALLGFRRNPRVEDLAGDRPVPDSGEEGVLSLGYSWLHRKPDSRNTVLPRHGFGLALNYSISNADIFGDFSYQQATADGFFNQHLVGPFTLYNRTLVSTLTGDFAAQDSLGFFQDYNLNLLGISSKYLGLPPFLGSTENYYLRGSEKSLTGSRLLFSSLELRMPLLPALPLNIFGIRVGQSVLSGFVDYGAVWHKSALTDETTAGVEIRTAVLFGGAPIVQLGYGIGNSLQRWQENEDPRYYIHLGIVNPF